MFENFQPIGSISTPITRELALRTLSDAEYNLYEYLKRRLASANRIPRALKIGDIAIALHSTYWKVRNAKDGLKQKGLIETWTVTYKNPTKGPGYFMKTTYYRIKQKS